MVPSQDLNPRPVNCKSVVLPIVPSQPNLGEVTYNYLKPSTNTIFYKLLEGISPSVQFQCIWDKYKIIGFWGQKVKCQGHDETIYSKEGRGKCSDFSVRTCQKTFSNCNNQPDSAFSCWALVRPVQETLYIGQLDDQFMTVHSRCFRWFYDLGGRYVRWLCHIVPGALVWTKPTTGGHVTGPRTSGSVLRGGGASLDGTDPWIIGGGTIATPGPPSAGALGTPDGITIGVVAELVAAPLLPATFPPTPPFTFGGGDFGLSRSMSSLAPVRYAFGSREKNPEYVSGLKFMLVRSGPTVSHPGRIDVSLPKRCRRRRPRQKCSMMWNISTGFSALPHGSSSAITRSMSTLAWMKSPSVLRRTVPRIPIRQCSWKQTLQATDISGDVDHTRTPWFF